MNSITRVVGQDARSQRINAFSVSASGVWLTILVAALFLSAFAIVYVKDINRRLFIQEQMINKQNLDANEAWSKLLLEQSTLTAQSRVARIAENKLGMTLPQNQTVKLVINTHSMVMDG